MIRKSLPNKGTQDPFGYKGSLRRRFVDGSRRTLRVHVPK